MLRRSTLFFQQPRKSVLDLLDCAVVTTSDLSNARRVADAYAEYFNDIRIRKGWRPAGFSLEQAKPVFAEASVRVIAIRRALDSQTDGEVVMRQIDGAAQEFLHTPEAQRMITNNELRDVTRQLVHATFKDSRGLYVERLNPDLVEKILDKWELKSRAATSNRAAASASKVSPMRHGLDLSVLDAVLERRVLKMAAALFAAGVAYNLLKQQTEVVDDA